MAQDTRKDPRAKVLSMTVRYKSATIDEFIEHHSHDVSRGGIFIKTPSPFPPGTLLKFEIRIQDEQAVLAGVGRVVWKRETGQATSDQPAGMGVKFIKIDDKSKALIARLVESHEGPSTYESGKPADGVPPSPPAVATPIAAAPVHKPGPAPSTLLGVGPGAAAAAAAVAAATAAKSSSGAPAAGTPAAKRASTMLGLGAIGSTPSKSEHTLPTGSSPPRPEPRGAEPTAASGEGFFPKTNPEAEMPPPEERTVMKQAAELLQQALAEAGGSMEEIGTPAAPAAKEAPKPAEPARAAEPYKEASRENGASAAAHLAAAATAEKKEPAAITADERTPTLKPAPRAEPAEAKPRLESVSRPEAAAPRKSDRPVARAAAIDRDEKPEGGSGRFLMLLLVAAAVGIGVWLYMNRMPGDTAEVAPPEATAPVEATAAPVETAKPAETAAVDTAVAPPTAAPSTSASAAPTATASATATATAAAKTAAPAAPKPPPPAPKPPPAAATGAAPTPPAPKPPPAAPKKPADDPYG